MSRQRVPSYRHHRPSGQAVVTLDDRDFHLGPWISRASRTEYEQLTGERLANGRRLPGNGPNSDLRICELLAAYRRFAKGYYAVDGEPNKEFVCMQSVIDEMTPGYSRTRVQDFGPLALKALRQGMVDRGLCRTQANQRVNRIRRIFKWGVENELVRSDLLHALQSIAPLKRGRTPARESEPVRPVPDAHVDAVLPLVARQVAAMIELQRMTGMRSGEVVLMRPCDINRSENVWVYRPTEHKTAYRGRAREVYLGPKAQGVLVPWLLRDAASYCFSPAEAESERNAIRRANSPLKSTPDSTERVGSSEFSGSGASARPWRAMAW